MGSGGFGYTTKNRFSLLLTTTTAPLTAPTTAPTTAPMTAQLPLPTTVAPTTEPPTEPTTAQISTVQSDCNVLDVIVTLDQHPSDI